MGGIPVRSPVRRAVTVLVAAMVCASVLGGCEELRRREVASQPSAPAPVAAPVAPIQTGPLVSQAESSAPSGESGLTQPELYYGGASPLHSTQLAQGISEVGDGDLTINFANAEIREVVNAILGDALGLTYVIDPRVQGTITLRSVRPVPRAAAVGLLEDVLAMNGAALVAKEGAYEIVPLGEAVSAPAIVRQGTAPVRMDRGYSLHVFPLRYASAAALMDVIQPLAPPGRVLRVDAERNLLILAATSSEADNFADLLSLFDVDWMADKSFGLFPLKHGDAEHVAAELRRVFAQPGAEEGKPGIVDFVPIERLNAVMVITGQEAYLTQARDWVARLDRGMETDKRQLYVYFVQNGRAQELAQIVGEALSAEVVKTEEVAPEARLAPGLAPAEMTSPGGTPVMGGDTGAETGGTDTLSDAYGTNQPLQRLHPTAGDQGGLPDIGISGGTEAPQTGFRIVADARNNALLVHATAEEYELVAAALEKLDIVPLQVFIEATIAEVTLNDTLKYGLEWFFDLGNSNVSFNTATPRQPTTPQPNLILSQFPGFSWLYSTDDVRIVLNALSAITDLKVISSPTLLVLDNEPARLQVGDQVPISVRSSTSVTDPEAPTVNEIEYRDTGVILDIIPRVNSNGMVVLDIIQEVSDVVPSTANATDTQTITPTIAQRRIASTVSVSSGETVALGGLIRDTDSEGVTGVPLLSDIPILGNLFKTTTDLKRRTELLVLLTPRVVRDPNDARTVTDELRKRLRAVESLPQLIQ
jgi:general secretion pathway protein D